MRKISALATAAVIGSLQSATAFQLLTKEPKETVCISLAAYEEKDYIDALIFNFLGFSERSTKLSIHFNNKTDYNGTETEWESDRVTVSAQRVDVTPFHGSIMYAHLLNAKQMNKKWPGQCKYWVLQASNMMWVRSGMEEMVRSHKYSPIGGQTTPGDANCATDHAKAMLADGGKKRDKELPFPAFFDRLAGPQKMYGAAQPDGSFFPMNAVLGLFKMVNDFSEEIGDEGEFVFEAFCDLEDKWLPTYSLNWMGLADDFPEKQRHESWTPLCYSKIKDHPDSIPVSFVDEVHDGKHEGYYAVKRVNRNPDHPVTSRIMALSRAALARNS